MKNLQSIVVALLAAFGMVACLPTAIKSNMAKSINIYGTRAVPHPILADLIVDSVKASGTASAGALTNIEIVKRDAVENLLRSLNADILIEPRFESIVFRGNRTINVTGYPAKYKNFRTATPDDTTFIKYMDGL